MEAATPSLQMQRIVECMALVAAGAGLRRMGVLAAADAETALGVASVSTLPAALLNAALLHAASGVSAPSLPALLAGGGVVLVGAALSAAAAWLQHAPRSKRERALLSGCSVGGAATAVALPLAQALLGPTGALAAAAVVLADALAGAFAYLLVATAGPAFPASYAHADGGEYRGEWRGLAKEGLGVYRYLSGARYEGEWRDNVKDGRGVYYYPKGGTYEGEWSAGAMSGVGVRTYSTGRVAAGRWRNNQLETALELRQCAAAAEGAAEAALAARAVRVGGGRPVDAAAWLGRNPAVWAAAAALLVATFGGQWVQSGAAAAGGVWRAVASAAAALAPAHAPLALIAIGACLPAPRPDRGAAGAAADAVAVAATRGAAGLFVAANALALAGAGALPAAALPGCIVGALALVGPCACGSSGGNSSGSGGGGGWGPRALAREFRLNEQLAAAAAVGTSLSAIALVPLLAAGAVAAGIVAPGGAPVTTGAAAAAAVTRFATVLLGAAAAVCLVAGPVHEKLRPQRKVKLVYVGARPPADAASGAAAAASTSSGEATTPDTAPGGFGGGSSGSEGGSSGGEGPSRPAAAAIAPVSGQRRHTLPHRALPPQLRAIAPVATARRVGRRHAAAVFRQQRAARLCLR